MSVSARAVAVAAALTLTVFSPGPAASKGKKGGERVPDHEVLQNVFASASHYARAISCETELKPKMVVPLVPWTAENDVWDARYAFIWQGDLGCLGGSGSSRSYIVIVGLGMAASAVVHPEESSPAVKFNIPIRHVEQIIKAGANELIVAGRNWGERDAMCCPSIPVEIRMRRDEKYNWNVIEEQKTKE